MPRRKAADRVGSTPKRTRSGCSQCRSRKVKCDEARPQCANCVSRGFCCQYQQLRLKWEAEYVASGRAFGREGVWSKDKGHASGRRSILLRRSDQGKPSVLSHGSGTLIEKHHFVHTFHLDIGRDGRNGLHLSPRSAAPSLSSQSVTRHAFASPPCSSSSEAAVNIPRSPSAYPTIDGFDPGLLEYYFLRICPQTNHSRHSASPFSELLMPLICSGGHDLASLSAMAFSARHRSLTCPQWSHMALSLKGKALTALRKSLGVSDGMVTCALRNSQVPIAMMFLCLYEIIDSCDHRWVIHLRASQDFLYRRKQLPPPSVRQTAEEREQVALAERFFAFQEAISRTACASPSAFTLDYWQITDRNRDDPSWMGCSARLAATLSRTTELGRMKGWLAGAEFERRSLSLEDALASLVLDPDDPYGHLMRESARLYQHCLLRDATPSTPIVAELVQRILQALYNLIRETGCVSSGLAFPLFVSAVELDPLNEEPVFRDGVTGKYLSGRRLVLEILHVISGSCLFNAERIGGVIRQVWANRDLHAVRAGYGGLEGASAESATGLNDWNVCVSPYCTNISLA